MKFITISGLDGSGKSTQIEMLKNHLEHGGSKVFYFHAVEFSLAKKITDFKNKYCLICKLLGKCKVYREKSAAPRSSSLASEPAIGVTHANAFQIYLRKIFLRIDIWRFGLLRNTLRNKNYDYILSDRYFYDSIVNIKFLENKDASDTNKDSTLDSRIRGNDNTEKPDLAIYLQLSPESIMSRERVPDQGMEYLRVKKNLYDAALSVWNFKVIDGNQTKDIIFEKIKLLISQSL